MNELLEATSKDIAIIIPRLMQTFFSSIRECSDDHIPVAHFRIIAMLMEKPMKISDLAKSQNISKASISDSVKMLYERGWVVKIEDPQDRRIVFLEVSEDGKKRMEEMFEKLRQIIQSKLSQTPERELLVIHESLRILSDRFISADQRSKHFP